MKTINGFLFMCFAGIFIISACNFPEAIPNSSEIVSIQTNTPPRPTITSRPYATKIPTEIPRSPFSYHEESYLFTNHENDQSSEYEPNLIAADFTGDGLEDLLVYRLRFQTYDTFRLGIIQNNGDETFTDVTVAIFLNGAPQVQNPREVVLADFNGDGISDIFVADHGYDVSPHPGYQNQLALSQPDGSFINATINLPSVVDFTHSAAAGDVDNDGDIDIYVGNIWGEKMNPPYLLINDGNGKFEKAADRLPFLLDLTQNGFTSCSFVDLNNDGAIDLVLGDAGDDIANEASTSTSEILLNDGNGYFSQLPGALPDTLNSPYDIVHDIEAVDVNGDSFPDLIFTAEREGLHGSYLKIVINQGDATFVDETNSRLMMDVHYQWIPKTEMRDLDGDDDFDIIVFPFDSNSPSPYILVNDGQGHFEEQTLMVEIPYLYYSFIDVQGDGGHDIIYVSFAPPEEYHLLLQE